jgi:hypothetical protein
MDISDKDKKGHKRLTRAGQSELVCLLGGIDHVAGSISQCYDLRPRRLRLQQM